MHWNVVQKTLYPRYTFRIARGSKFFVENIYVSLEQDGQIGYGEASPNRYYQEEASTIYLSLLRLTDALKTLRLDFHSDIWFIQEELSKKYDLSAGARCALDLALWDLWGKKKQCTLSELLWRKKPKPLLTSLTLGLTNPEELKVKMKELKDSPLLKLKAGSTEDWLFFSTLFHSLKLPYYLDANTGWDLEKIKYFTAQFYFKQCVLIEQPFLPGEEKHLPEFDIPFLADEAWKQEEDLEKLIPYYQGINIKIVKAGGISKALKLMEKARSLNLKIMIGCMLESSLLISAGFALAQQADWVDLDGAWLLKEDPFFGLSLKNGLLQASQEMGLGVCPNF